MRQHSDLAKESAEKVVKDIRLQLHALAYNLANFCGRWLCPRRSSSGR
jgi:hypothetical protein